MFERKSLRTEFKFDASKNRVEAYASTFGDLDGNDDVVLKGAYADTLKTDLPKNQIKVKRNHTTIIGKPIHAEEDSTGLLTVSEISQTELGKETLILVQDGAMDQMSIAFKAMDRDYVVRNGRRVREVKAAKLYEWSFMDDIPANMQAGVVGFKSLYDVGCAIDQMSSALWHLRALGDTPPEVLTRLIQLAGEIEDLNAAAEKEEDSVTLNSVAAALSEMNSLLTSSRGAAA